MVVPFIKSDWPGFVSFHQLDSLLRINRNNEHCLYWMTYCLSEQCGDHWPQLKAEFCLPPFKKMLPHYLIVLEKERKAERKSSLNREATRTGKKLFEWGCLENDLHHQRTSNYIAKSSAKCHEILATGNWYDMIQHSVHWHNSGIFKRKFKKEKCLEMIFQWKTGLLYF